MIVLPLTYVLELDVILQICDSYDAILINTNVIKSIEEIKLAEFLARKSFAEETNIGKKFKYEFLLWLTGKRDIKSALLLSKPNKNNAILILFKESDKNKILEKLMAQEIKVKLKEKSDILSLEKISLSRIVD